MNHHFFNNNKLNKYRTMKEKKITCKLDYYIDFVKRVDKTDKTKWYNFPYVTTNKNDCYQMDEKGRIRYYNLGWYCDLTQTIKNENGSVSINLLNDEMQWVEVDVVLVYLEIFGQFPNRKTMQHLNIEEIAKKIPLEVQKQTYNAILRINNIQNLSQENKEVVVKVSMNLIKTNFKPYINTFNDSEQTYICERFFNLCMKKIFREDNNNTLK